MKKVFLLLVIYISIFSAIYAHSNETITGEFNIENPLSMYYSSNFSSKSGLSFGRRVLSGSSNMSDMAVHLSLASNFFGIGVDFLSSISDQMGDSAIYRHEFIVNFVADYGINNFSFGAKWNLGGTRLRELLDVKANYLSLAECIFTLHNDNYIEENNSSLSFFTGYYDRQNISLCLYSKDFLVLNQSNLSFVASSILDNMGASIMLKTSQFDLNDIKNSVQMIGSLSIDNILTKKLFISSCVEFKFNISKDADISFINSLDINTSKDASTSDLQNKHKCKVQFNVLGYKISLEAQIPLSSYKGSREGAVVKAGFNITRG